MSNQGGGRGGASSTGNGSQQQQFEEWLATQSAALRESLTVRLGFIAERDAHLRDAETASRIRTEARRTIAPTARTIADSVASPDYNSALYATEQRGARYAAAPPVQTDSSYRAYNPEQTPSSAVSARWRPDSMPDAAAFEQAFSQRPVAPRLQTDLSSTNQASEQLQTPSTLHSVPTGRPGSVSPMSTSSGGMSAHGQPGSIFRDPVAAQGALNRQPAPSRDAQSRSARGGFSPNEMVSRARQVPTRRPAPGAKKASR